MRRPAAWIALAAFVAYAALLQLTPIELLRSLAGLIALWGPLAVLAFAALRRNVPDLLPRAVLAAIASYALTTALYFACCVIWSPVLFYTTYGTMVAAAAGVLVVRRTAIRAAWRDRRIDWTLVAVVALTLVAFSRYQHPYELDPRTMDVGIITSADQTYFCGLAYELARHTPPVQQVCQAGIPERAYHLFPHLAAMLTSRFTGQPDMMRAHMVYHYATLTVLTSLALYVIVSRLAASRVAGYTAAASLAIFAIPMPPLAGGSPGAFGFTLSPLATSLTEPTFITSPQTYAGLTVAFGVLAGVVLICERLRQGAGLGTLAAVCGLMVANLLRFRAHIFIPMFPGFLAVLAYAWLRSKGRQRSPLIAAAAVTTVAAVLLFAEMGRAGYLRDTNAVRIAFHPNYRQFMDSWPLADEIRRVLCGPSISGGTDAGYGWQTFSILIFAALNLIGLPALTASVVWFSSRRNRSEWGPYAALTACLVIGSVAGALFLTSAYDPYSLGGQMLLHTGWYLLPLLAVGAWQLIRWTLPRTTWDPRKWTYLAWVLVLAATFTQVTRGFSPLERHNWKHGVVMTENVWHALNYLHDRTPTHAVVLCNGPIEPEFNWSVIPGVAGRASYLTYTEVTSALLPQAAGGAVVGTGRQAMIDAIWQTTSPERFASLLAGTGAHYLVEFSTRPLTLAPLPPGLLREVWASPPAPMGRVRIFQVLKQAGASAAPDEPVPGAPPAR